MSPAESRGREDTTEYQDLLGILRSDDPGGAVILGGVGMGKSSLVEAVLQAQPATAPVMRLYCSPTLSEIPYGVLSPYLGALEHVGEPVKVLRELNKVLAEAGPEHGRVVVVEDAQYLDAQSCFVLSMLMENSALKLITVGAGTLDVESPLGSLASSSLMTTVVIRPLDVHGVRAAAESLVDGRLSESAVRTLWYMSGGNPSFVRAHVLSALEQGILFSESAPFGGRGAASKPVWILARDLPDTDARLTDLVREVHRLSSEPEQRTLELLALGGPQPTALLAAPEFSFRRMLDAGTLQLVAADTVALSSELHQYVLRRMVPARRSAELFETWRSFIRSTGKPDTAWQMLWTAEIGEPVDPAQGLAAAEQAVADHNYALAAQLSGALDLPQHSMDGAMFQVRLLIATGRFYAARGLLVRLLQDLDDGSLLTAMFSQLLIVTTNVGTDKRQMQEFGQLWEEQAHRLNTEDERVRSLADRHIADRLLGYWDQVNGVGGNMPELAELEVLAADDCLPLEARIIALLMLCDLHGINGRNATAAQLAARMQELTGRENRLQVLYEAKAVFRLGWNHLMLGDYRYVHELMENYRSAGNRPIAHRQGVATLLEGAAHLLQGRIQQSVATLGEAVTELRLHDPGQALSVAVNLYRLALAHSGLLRAGQSPADFPQQPSARIADLPEYLGESPSRQRLLARGLAAAVGTPLGAETLADFPLCERLTLALLTGQQSDEQLQDSEASARLGRLAREHEGPRAQMLAELSAARLSPDPKPLEELAARAQHAGEYQMGLEALTRAAVRYSSQGEPRSCGVLLRKAARLIEQQHLDPTRYVSRALALTELTAREAEIVQLALAGKNNAQIARALIVSQRTVEGHLYRVFSKLGISDRSELSVAELDTPRGEHDASQYE